MKLRELSKLLTGLENRQASSILQLGQMNIPANPPLVLGITGPPGAGKSTLTDQLIKGFREKGKKVAVIAIDPSSPFTGGAILGDRIRMNSHSGDSGVFIRSVATRGHLGGTSASVPDFIRAFECENYEIIMVETVGVGQSEVEIISLADTVILVSVPGLGDEMQAMKAGIMEIADIMVVNKKDRPGAEITATALQAALDLGQFVDESATIPWTVPINLISSQSGDGMEGLFESIFAHREWMIQSSNLHKRRLNRARTQLYRFVHEALDRFIRNRKEHINLDKAALLMENENINCFQVAHELFENTPLEELIKEYQEQ